MVRVKQVKSAFTIHWRRERQAAPALDQPIVASGFVNFRQTGQTDAMTAKFPRAKPACAWRL
jgi:hypothetical protein